MFWTFVDLRPQFDSFTEAIRLGSTTNNNVTERVVKVSKTNLLVQCVCVCVRERGGRLKPEYPQAILRAQVI